MSVSGESWVIPFIFFSHLSSVGVCFPEQGLYRLVYYVSLCM